MKLVGTLVKLALGAGLLGLSLTASAAIAEFTDRAAFSGLGSITYNYGFDNLDTSASNGFLSVGDPWTASGITYNTGSNLVIGQTAGLGLANNVFSSNSANPGGLVSGTFNGVYSMFGLDLGTVFGVSPVNIVLNTTQGSYSFIAQAMAQTSNLSFYGFALNGGASFTSFSITDALNNTVPIIDNVTVGAVSPVPEPGPAAMMLSGLAILGLVIRWRSA